MYQLLPYLPYHVAAELLARPDTDPLDYARRLDAAVLFADVSGFTPMSEALGRHGQAGAEELTGLLNDYFEVMIDLVASYGGIIAAFGGDALTAIFPAPDGLAAAGARAVQCALDMQLLMLPYERIDTRAGSFQLAIKIGVAGGSILSTIVGDPSIRLQSIIAGAPVERAADAEHHAHTGEIAVDRPLAAQIAEVVPGEERAGFLIVSDMARRPAYAPLADLPDVPGSLQPILSAFVHPSIARRLLDDRTGFVNEHRGVTVLFVGFDGFDYDGDPLVHAHLQAYVASVSRVVQQYDGDLNKVDMGDKGSKFVVVFGAPVGHENDAERAMHCAIAIRDLDMGLSQAESGPIPALGSLTARPRVRIGIASGLVYCGLVGGAMRREYTVMGDTVNLAARLMQAAEPGQIVVESVGQRRAADKFLWEPLEPLPVRGRAQPATVYRLQRSRERASRHQEPAYKLPMVGREHELQLIEDRIEQALRGQGQVVGICAEAGMGKSRLVAEAIRSASRRGMRVLNGECLSYGGNISYLAWHNLLRGLFDLDPAWSHEAQIRHLREQIAAVDPQILARLPLLGVALNLPLEESDLTRSLDARMRKDALETTVIACVRAIAGGQRGEGRGEPASPRPLLMVIEDCHWIDPLSHELLELVARSTLDRPVLILLAYRPPEHPADRLRVARLAHFSELFLREFSLRETEWLIGLKFGYLFGAQGVLPAGFIQRIIERSQGNPFYIDQMINFIQDQGISPADTLALERLTLPDSLRSLIISRIDRLSEQEQVTLKVASVLGRVFRASWLWGIYPQLGRPEQVRAHLDMLSQLDLTPMEKAEPELEYLFKHIVTQEVAYESLALATRMMLHEQVGAYIEEQFADDLDRYLDMLAYHYGRSANQERQRHYFQLAAAAAQAAYANDVALDYYQRLLPLLRPDDQIVILLRLGALLQLVGRWGEAEERVRQALGRAEAQGSQATIARCKTDLAHLLASRGDYDEAIAMIDEVMPIWERLDNPSGHYDALWVLGYVLIDIGEYTRGLRQLEHTHEIAVRLGDEQLIATSIGSMGQVYVDIGDYEMALYCLERSAAGAQRFSDWGLLARTRGNTGFIYMSQGRLAAAMTAFHDLLLRAVEIGDRRALAKMAREIGRCRQLAGDLEGARHCYAIQLGMGLELGEKRDLSIGLGYLAGAYAEGGDELRAERLFDLAITLCDSIRLVYWGCQFRYDLARMRLRQGSYAEAAALNRAALETARRLGSHKTLQLAAGLLDARLAVLLGERAAAEAIAGLEGLDEDWFDAAERAAIHDTIWQIDPARAGDRARATALYATMAAEAPTRAALERYAALSGQAAPPAPPLPESPALLGRIRYDLDALIEQAEALVGAVA